MWICPWQSKSWKQRLLGSPLSTLLGPETCTVSLCYSLHGRLPHVLADSDQFQHDLHHASSIQPPFYRKESELPELRTRWRGSHLSHTRSFDHRDWLAGDSGGSLANRLDHQLCDGRKYQPCSLYYDEWFHQEDYQTMQDEEEAQPCKENDEGKESGRGTQTKHCGNDCGKCSARETTEPHWRRKDCWRTSTCLGQVQDQLKGQG